MRYGTLLAISLVAGSVTALATAQTPSDQDVLSRAIELHQTGHYAEAIEGYQLFLSAHPEAAQIRSNLGAALVQEGRLNEAVEQYKEALEVMPSDQSIQLNLGLAYYKMGDVADAVPQFEAVAAALAADEPRTRQVKLLLADCYLREGHEDRVVSLLSRLADSDPNDVAVSYLLGTALLHLGQQDRGAQMIEHIMRRGDTFEGHMLMAFTYMQANDTKPGLAEVKRAIEFNPNLPEAYTLLGRLDYINSYVEDAEVAFRKALSLDPNAFEALLYLGVLMRKQGRSAEARPLIERALHVRPSDPLARYHFAMLSADEGDDERAAALLCALAKDAPQYTEAHRSLATIDFRLGKVDEGRAERKAAESLAAQVAAHDQERGRSLRQTSAPSADRAGTGPHLRALLPK